MKKAYQCFELQIFFFEEQDVVRTSQPVAGSGDFEVEGYSPGWW